MGRDKDFSLNGLLETAYELINQGGSRKDCIRACKALTFFPRRWQLRHSLIFCVYRDVLRNGDGDFEDYGFLCENGRELKYRPEVAVFGLKGMKQTAQKPKERRETRRNARLMEEFVKANGWRIAR